MTPCSQGEMTMTYLGPSERRKRPDGRRRLDCCHWFKHHFAQVRERHADIADCHGTMTSGPAL